MALEKLGASLDVSRYVQKDETGTLVATQEKNRYVSTPEQLRALQICEQLDDRAHKIYYLSLCKKLKPEIISQALTFIADAQAQSRPKLFMWKIKQITQDWKRRGLDPHRPAPPVTRPKSRRRVSVGQQESLF